MKNRKSFILLLFVFILLLSFSIFLYFELKKSPAKDTEELTKDIGTNYIISRPGDPIEKEIGDNKERIVYNIQGYFTDKLELRDGLLVGRFIIRDDPLTREIDVLIGAVNGEVRYGAYQDSFNGSVTWKTRPSALVKELIEPNTPVLIRLDLPITQDPRRINYISKIEGVLDQLAREFQVGEYELEIPVIFTLASPAIGVIK